MPSARDLRMSAEARRQSAIDKMMTIGAERKRQQQAWLDRDAAANSRDQRMNDTDWWSKAGSGMGIGAMFGPTGGLVGGLIGGGIGLMGAAKRRQAEGQGFLESIGNSLFDLKPLTSGHALPGVVSGAAGMAGAIQGAKDRGEWNGFFGGSGPGSAAPSVRTATGGTMQGADMADYRGGLAVAMPETTLPELPTFQLAEADYGVG